VLTALLYLNDVGPELGGATRFTKLGIDVRPKKGRLVLWPSVLDEDLARPDRRTDHEARPLKGGGKWCANVWIHLDRGTWHTSNPFYRRHA